MDARAKAERIRKAGERWKRLREDYECKGRIRAQKGATPAFCYRVRGEETPRGKVHVVQLVSRRTGKPIGFISTDYKLTSHRGDAHEWNYLNKVTAEWFMRQSIADSRSRHRLDAESRALVKSIDEAARAKTR